MIAIVLGSSLVGCGFPFLMFFFVSIASLCLSMIIGADAADINSVGPSCQSFKTSGLNSCPLAFLTPHSPVKNLKSNDNLNSRKLIIPQSPLHMANLKLVPINMDFISSKSNQAHSLNLWSHTYDGTKIHYSSFNNSNKLDNVKKHYSVPPTSVELLRKRYGTRKSLWGEWSTAETRAFYRTNLPRALQIDGAMGFSLEERARLASEARHALRIYSRERCNLPARLTAEIYDGLRHFQMFGYWSCEGMSWSEVKEKYSREAIEHLGTNASVDDIELYVYRRVVDRACATNPIFDQIAKEGKIEKNELVELVRGIFATNDKINGNKYFGFKKKKVIKNNKNLKQVEDDILAVNFKSELDFFSVPTCDESEDNSNVEEIFNQVSNGKKTSDNMKIREQGNVDRVEEGNVPLTKQLLVLLSCMDAIALTLSSITTSLNIPTLNVESLRRLNMFSTIPLSNESDSPNYALDSHSTVSGTEAAVYALCDTPMFNVFHNVVDSLTTSFNS